MLPIGVPIALWLIPDELIDECRGRAGDEIDVGRARWMVASIVLLIWIVIGVLAIRTFTSGI